jgi:hypothetical protein
MSLADGVAWEKEHGVRMYVIAICGTTRRQYATKMSGCNVYDSDVSKAILIHPYQSVTLTSSEHFVPVMVKDDSIWVLE